MTRNAMEHLRPLVFAALLLGTGCFAVVDFSGFDTNLQRDGGTVVGDGGQTIENSAIGVDAPAQVSLTAGIQKNIAVRVTCPLETAAVDVSLAAPAAFTTQTVPATCTADGTEVSIPLLARTDSGALAGQTFAMVVSAQPTGASKQTKGSANISVLVGGSPGAIDGSYGATANGSGLLRLSTFGGIQRASPFVDSKGKLFVLGSQKACTASVQKIDEGGFPVAAFGQEGLATVEVCSDGAQLDDDDHFFVYGRNPGSGPTTSVFRLNAETGDLDTSFGAGGVAPTPLPDYGGVSVRRTPQGYSLARPSDLPAGNLTLARLLPGGAPDVSFGSNGLQSIPLGSQTSTLLTDAGPGGDAGVLFNVARPHVVDDQGGTFYLSVPDGLTKSPECLNLRRRTTISLRRRLPSGAADGAWKADFVYDQAKPCDGVPSTSLVLDLKGNLWHFFDGTWSRWRNGARDASYVEPKNTTAVVFDEEGRLIGITGDAATGPSLRRYNIDGSADSTFNVPLAPLRKQLGLENETLKTALLVPNSPYMLLVFESNVQVAVVRMFR